MKRLGALLLVLTLAAAPQWAAARAPAPDMAERAVVEIRRAINEERLLDAARMLDEASLGGMKDPRLNLLGGELNLARGRYNAALADYQAAEQTASTHAQALEGQGLALALAGRSGEAVPVLQRAVAEDPNAWRAWNALGAEYDGLAKWDEADDAYAHAIDASGGAAQALNNRGYSRLLRHQRDAAVADFVAALAKRPDLAEARTNLRLALAMGGDYRRATAGGVNAETAANLNNAGFAAGMRGDYAAAEDLLEQAMATKGEYYDRASANLEIVRALAARAGDDGHVVP
ncbi:hypothetical protein [Phenylobacterium sp.]|uniref:hypothetical protein n=1 Tax=Phenylobacterium sp. TaxID=1871053 RepID=UPI0035B14B81